ncbi:MAG: hypothetical protein J7L82_04515 [Staphylothermus sp.]|nr:hypothetical protein [Staphylothermus sp.]
MSLAEKIQLLRRIDSIIDFNRATAQLRILIALNNEERTIDEIVMSTGLKRKTVLDAVRKLEIKGLVEKQGNRCKLTELGRNIYNALLNVAGEDPKNIPAKPSLRTTYYEIYDQLLNVVYMLRAVQILGDAGNKPLSLKELAKKINVSQATLNDHISKFVSGNVKIFEKIYDIERNRACLRLTELGLKIYTIFYNREKRKYKYLRYLILVLPAFFVVFLLIVVMLFAP